MKRPTKRTSRRNAAAKALAKGRYRQRIVKNRKIYTRKGRRPQDSGLSSSLAGKLASRAWVGLWLGRARPQA